MYQLAGSRYERKFQVIVVKGFTPQLKAKDFLVTQSHRVIVPVQTRSDFHEKKKIFPCGKYIVLPASDSNKRKMTLNNGSYYVNIYKDVTSESEETFAWKFITNTLKQFIRRLKVLRQGKKTQQNKTSKDEAMNIQWLTWAHSSAAMNRVLQVLFS